MLHMDSFLSQALPISPNWNASTERLVAPSPAASRPSLILLSEASLPPIQVTLTHFTLSSCERALRFPISFPISGLSRLGAKPRLCRSSWRAFASTHASFYFPYKGSFCLPSLSSLEPRFHHHGVYPFLSMLSL